MESCDDDIDSKEMQESRDDDSCHADSGLLSMLAEVASATLHNDSLARKTRGNARGRPRKQTAEGRLDPDQPEPTDTNKLSLGQLELLTEKQLVDLFSLMDSDEIRRTFSYSCHLLQRCQFTSSSFGSEMKARQVNYLGRKNQDCYSITSYYSFKLGNAKTSFGACTRPYA